MKWRQYLLFVVHIYLGNHCRYQDVHIYRRICIVKDREGALWLKNRPLLGGAGESWDC